MVTHLEHIVTSRLARLPRKQAPARRARPAGTWRRAWLVRWLAVAAIALGSVAVVPGTANAITGCPGGWSYNDHCYAYGFMGDDGGQPPIWMNAVGTDLDVACLSVPNGNTDLATYELWMGTNDNGAANTWVEEGMLYGVGIDGKNHGFTWFWADMRNPTPSNFHEHFGPGASVNTWTNASFYWLGSGNWNVERAGTVLGESKGVGDFAGDAETGTETSINQGHVFGESNNFQYADPSWKWHPAPTSWYNGYNGHGWLYATGENGSPGSFTEAFSDNECGSSAAPRVARPAPITAATAAARLTAIAMRAARASGDADPRGIEFVATTRHRAQALLGEGIPQRNASYLVQLRGHFTGYDASVPPGKKLPAGDVMTLTVSAATGAVTDVSLTNAAVNLRALGRPTVLG
jgi:hypothetical protein